MYKTGIATRQAILDSAKLLFLEKGYKNTSVSDICEKSGVKTGSFIYYFPKKTDLLKYLYRDYAHRCQAYLDQQKLNLSISEYHIHVVMFYYMRLYRNEAAVRFHNEVISNSTMNVWFDDHEIILGEFAGGKSDPALWQLYVMADNAVRRELNLRFMQEKEISAEKVFGLVKEIYTVNAKLFDISLNDLDTWLVRARRFALDHIDAPVSLL